VTASVTAISYIIARKFRMSGPFLKINPVEIRGNWEFGWALDYHTLSSKYDKAGRYYITDRTELGEVMYKFKYKRRFWLAGKIARTAVRFLKDNGLVDKFDLIVAIPPARFRLFYQPVKTLAKKIGRILDKPVDTRILKRTKKIPQIKSMEDRIEREKLVKGLFSVGSNIGLTGNVLLFDDLYRSGTTLREAVRALKSEARINEIAVLTITRTRVRK
jgi:competence protein ComFC